MNNPGLIKKAIPRLEELQSRIEKIINEGLAYDSPKWGGWEQEVKEILRVLYRDNSAQEKDFVDKTMFYPRVSYEGYPTEEDTQNLFNKMLPHAKAFVEAQLRALRMQMPEQPPPSLPVRGPMGPPGILGEWGAKGVSEGIAKAFIAHGGETLALIKLKKFLEAVGVEPLVVEDQPSLGRSVNEQVLHYMGKADCAIILGTADDKNLKDGKLYPRPNVHIEIGRCQERFPDKIIFLLQEGASFPSNISEKVWERFTSENMEGAFIKVAKELRAFGISKAVSIETVVGSRWQSKRGNTF